MKTPSNFAVRWRLRKYWTIFFFRWPQHQYCEFRRRLSMFFRISQNFVHRVEALDLRFPMPSIVIVLWNAFEVIFKSRNRKKSGENSKISVFAEPGRSGIKTFHSSKIEESNRARECPRFYLPTLEMYDVECCPVFQVVVF